MIILLMALGMGSAYGYGVLDDNECSRGGYCFALKVPKGDRERAALSKLTPDGIHNKGWMKGAYIYTFYAASPKAAENNGKNRVGTFNCGTTPYDYYGYNGLDKHRPTEPSILLPPATGQNRGFYNAGQGVGVCHAIDSLYYGKLSNRFQLEVDAMGTTFQYKNDDRAFQQAIANCNFIRIKVEKRNGNPLISKLMCYENIEVTRNGTTYLGPGLVIDLKTLETANSSFKFPSIPPNNQNPGRQRQQHQGIH